MSFGVSVGVSTWSITWMNPLLVPTSAWMTVAPLTMTVEPTVNESGCPFAAVADIQSVTFDAGTSPATTW